MKTVIFLIVFCLGVIATGETNGAELNDKDRVILESFVAVLERSQGKMEEDEISQIYKEYGDLLYGKGVKYRKALKFFETKKAVSIIAEGLLRGNPHLRVEHVGALGRLKQRSAVAQLIESLKQNNYIQEGSEEATG